MDTWGVFLGLIIFSVTVNGEVLNVDNEIENSKGQRRNSKMAREFWSNSHRSHVSFPLFHKNLLNNDKAQEEEEFDELYPKIVGGRPAMMGEYPWMVSLHYKNKFLCSAFLISPTTVMTAAHCVVIHDEVKPASRFHGIIGNIHRDGPEMRISFSEVSAHPRYGVGSEYDIALLRVESPIETNATVKPVCIAGPGRESDNVHAMGWGVTSSETREEPDLLMTTELSVPNGSMCRMIFVFMGVTITDRHMCAGSIVPTGVCFGDSGGPAVYDDPISGQPVAVGVASFITGLGCGRPVLPSVYTRINAYLDWIKEAAGDSSSDICIV